MKTKRIFKKYLILPVILLLFIGQSGFSQKLKENPELDKKVKAFLADKGSSWYDMNVPKVDAEKLYELIIENNYKSALEIGTSTGYSSIHIAWALSKTGGKLITIDIDEGRHSEALKNFEEAGLSEYIDARLADAHSLVKELEGPFDFVFSDADKGWYKNYFLEVGPKLEIGGCYTTHNIREGRNRRGGNVDYLNFIKGLGNYETTLYTPGGGLLISFKKAD